MTRGSTRSGLRRLEQLRGLLQARDRVTAAELAAELDVSVRTLWRDVDILRDDGLPIDSDRGRGGGLRLHRGWGLGRLHLDHLEAIDLLLALAMAEKMGSPLLLQHLPAIRRKVSGAFAHAHQGRIKTLRRRILLGQPASERILGEYEPPPRARLAVAAQAFFEARCLKIEYVDQARNVSTREIEPQFLYLNVPVWYLLVWDRMRAAIRFFRVDRIRAVTITDNRFRLADVRPYLAEAERNAQSL
ncbi:MAG: helix-turn-helix transcriptional regulator [Dongiaceae bacterium]